MLGVMITGQRRAQDTLEAFNYEFEVVHPALMRSARCERYIQHYAQSKPLRALPQWDTWLPVNRHTDSHVSIIVRDPHALAQCFNDPEYVRQVMPHRFTDPAASTLNVTEPLTLKAGTPPPGAIKLIHYLASQPGMDRAAFRSFIDGAYTDTVIGPRAQSICRHRRCYALPAQPQPEQGSPFAHLPATRFGVIEELWLEDADALSRFYDGDVSGIRKRISALDLQASFSLITTERTLIADNLWL
jgi:hypothetical protein